MRFPCLWTVVIVRGWRPGPPLRTHEPSALATLSPVTTALVTTPRQRLRATLAAAALGSTLLGGCAVFSPVQTDVAYQAADGVNATFGALDVRGVVVVSRADGETGNITGQLVNTSNEDMDVAFSSEGVPGGQLTVPRHSSVSLGDEGGSSSLPTVKVKPGDVLQLRIATPETGQNLLTVPVLPPTYYYKGYAPASPSPSASATP